ncbi:MAG: hypothetical protein ACLRFJ_01130 [Alphaproteobacteria bacterium]
MTNKIITSALTIVCVLCGGWVSGVFAAPSVRALGGAGTYTGTTSAAAARANGTTTTSARAGSVRVTPSVKVSSSTTPRSSNTGTKASGSDDQRMSIGKYLGPSVTGGTKVSTGGGTGTTSEEFTGLVNTVDELAGRVDRVDDQINDTSDGLVAQVDSLVAQIGGFVGEDYLTQAAADGLYQPKANATNPYVVKSDLSSTNDVFRDAVSGVVSALGGDAASIKSWVATEYGDAPDADGMYVLNRTATGAQWKKVDDYADDFATQGIKFEN